MIKKITKLLKIQLIGSTLFVLCFRGESVVTNPIPNIHLFLHKRRNNMYRIDLTSNEVEMIMENNQRVFIDDREYTPSFLDSYEEIVEEDNNDSW